MLVAGADPVSVEAAMKRSANKNSELAASKNFENGESAVPTAKQAFTYFDPALFYARIDAALRPMLFMSAAFLPGIGETVDLDKLPAAEVITKHLSPIVMSQNYDGDGYVAESIGPVTAYQTIMAAGALGTAATMFYQQQKQGLTPRAPAGKPRHVAGSFAFAFGVTRARRYAVAGVPVITSRAAG